MLINWFLCSQPALFCVRNAYIFTVVNLILYSYCICSVDAQSYKLCSSFFSARSGACGVCSLCKKLFEDQNTKEPSVRINTCARLVHELPRFLHLLQLHHRLRLLLFKLRLCCSHLLDPLPSGWSIDPASKFNVGKFLNWKGKTGAPETAYYLLFESGVTQRCL